MKKITYLIFIFFFAAFFVVFNRVSAQESTVTSTPDSSPTPTVSRESQRKELEERINELQQKVSSLQQQGETLKSQITVMDNQTKLTEFKINSTKQELESLGEDIEVAESKVSTLEGSMDKITKTLLSRIIATYQVGNIPKMHVLLAADNMESYLTRANYLRLVQAHDRQLLMNTQQAKMDYQNQKEIFESKKAKVESLKAQLEEYTEQLNQEKQSKQQLLSVTKNDEARYQRLLSEARAQISSFKSFASSQGGSGTIPAQSSADGWYFNQRDERWGNHRIGSSSESMWQVGCLVTATAMLRKQRGESITPADIARESSFFFSNTAMMLIPWNGGKFSSGGKDMTAMDNRLANGPIIVGLNAGPYGTHFIVLKSGSNGNYVMHDPWNGADLNFSDYYSTGQIFQYGYLK